MHLPVPEHRWLTVQDALRDETPPVDDAFLQLVYGVIKTEVEDEHVATAIELIEIPEYRDTMCAFILSNAPTADIVVSLGMTEEVINTFKQLYMDTTVFKHKLQLRAFIKYYLENVAIDDEYKALIELGVEQGSDHLIYRMALGDEKVLLDEAKCARNAITQAYFLSTLPRNADITSPRVRQALRWTDKWTSWLIKTEKSGMTDGGSADPTLAIDDREQEIAVERLQLDPKEVYH